MTVSTFQEGLQKKIRRFFTSRVNLTLRRMKLLIKVIQVYEVNHVEGVNMITRTH